MRRARVTALIWKEGEVYVSKAPELGVASAGDTPADALANLREAIELYLENARELGMLDEMAAALATDEKYTTSLEVTLR